MLSTLSSLPHLLDHPYLPSWLDIRGVAGFAVSLLLFFVLGSVVTPTSMPCWKSAWPQAGVGLRAAHRMGRADALVARIARRRTGPRRHRLAGSPGLACAHRPLGDALGRAWNLLGPRAAAHFPPLWLVMLSWCGRREIDTWLNLLPNAAYLFDHAVAADRAPPAQLLVPAGCALQQPVLRLHRVAGIRQLCRQRAMSFLNMFAALCAGLLFARVVAAKNTARMPPARTQAEVAETPRTAPTTAPDHELHHSRDRTTIVP